MDAGQVRVLLTLDNSQLGAGIAAAKGQIQSGLSGALGGAGGQIQAGLSGALAKGSSFKEVGSQLGGQLVDGITAPFGTLGGVAGTAAKALGPVGIAGVAVAAAVTAVGAASVGAAAEWEKGMSQISKTTGIEKGTTEFQNLNSELKNILATTPTTVSELQSVASTAGSLGVKPDQIAGYTKAAIMMGSAFDIPAEQAAVSVGKIQAQMKNVTDNSTDFAMRFGSAVDMMGNNYNATERDVLDFSTRVAGSLSSLGAGAYDVAGWGGMLASVFPSAERAAGSFDALLTNLTTNEDAQAQAAQLLGISTEEFAQAMSTTPTETLLDLGSALEGLDPSQLMSVTKTLGGAYGMDTLIKMTGHTEEWAKAIDEARAAGEAPAGELSIAKSYEASVANLSAQAQIFKNSLKAIFVDIGTPMMGPLASLAGGVANVFNQIRASGENIWAGIANTKAFSAISQSVGNFGSLIGGVISTLAGLGAAIPSGAITAALDAILAPITAISSTANSAFSAISSGASQIGPAFEKGKALVQSFVEELKKVVTETQTFQTLSGIWDKITDGVDQAKSKVAEFVDGIKDKLQGLVDIGSKVWEGLTSSVSSAVSKGISSFFRKIGEKLGIEPGFWKRVTEGAGKIMAGEIGDGIKENEAEISDPLKEVTVNAAAKAGAFSGEAFAREFGARAGEISEASPEWKRGAWESVFDAGGVQMTLKKTVDKNGALFTLYDPAGNELGSEYIGDGRMSTMRPVLTGLLSKFLPYVDEGLYLEATNRPGEAAMWRLNQKSGIIIDLAAGLESEVTDGGQMISAAIEANWFDAPTIDAAIGRLNAFKAQGIWTEGAQTLLDDLERVSEITKEIAELEVSPEIKAKDEDALQKLAGLRAELDKLTGELYTIYVGADTTQAETALQRLYRMMSSGMDVSQYGITNPSGYFADYYKSLAQQGYDLLKSGAGGLIPSSMGIDQAQVDLFNEYMELWRIQGENIEYLSDSEEAHWLKLGRLLSGNVTPEAWEQYYLDMGAAAEKAAEATNGIKEALDATAESMKDCAECVLSDFALIQESAEVSSQLFFQSFIGPSSEYAAFMASEEARGAYRPSVVSTGYDYQAMAAAKQEPVQLSMTLNTAQADASLNEFQTKAKQEQQMPLAVDAAAAKATIEEVNAQAKAEVTKPLYVDASQAMSAISSINAAASAPVIKPVYVVTYGSAGGGGGGGTWLPAYETPLTTQYPFAEGGIVYGPTPALIGEAGYPEAVIPLKNGTIPIEGGGPGPVTIHSEIIIQGGTVISEEDLERALIARDEELTRRISAQVVKGQSL